VPLLMLLPFLVDLPAQPPSVTYWSWQPCVIAGPDVAPPGLCGHLWDFDFSTTVDLRDAALMMERWQCSEGCVVWEWRAGE
jgi:hypothetical protein